MKGSYLPKLGTVLTNESCSEVLSGNESEFLVVACNGINLGGLDSCEVENLLLVPAVDCVGWALE